MIIFVWSTYEIVHFTLLLVAFFFLVDRVDIILFDIYSLVNKLVLGDKKKDLQDRLKAILDEVKDLFTKE